MTLSELVKAVAGILSSAVLGLNFMIVVHYIRNAQRTKVVNWSAIGIVVSYTLITAAIVRSVFKEAYPEPDMWHLFVFSGLLIGIITLYFGFKRVVKKENDEKISDLIHKQNQKQ